MAHAQTEALGITFLICQIVDCPSLFWIVHFVLAVADFLHMSLGTGTQWFFFLCMTGVESIALHKPSMNSTIGLHF